MQYKKQIVELAIEIRQRTNRNNKHQCNKEPEFIQTIWKLWILSRQLKDEMAVISVLSV